MIEEQQMGSKKDFMGHTRGSGMQIAKGKKARSLKAKSHYASNQLEKTQFFSFFFKKRRKNKNKRQLGRELGASNEGGGAHLIPVIIGPYTPVGRKL